MPLSPALATLRAQLAAIGPSDVRRRAVMPFGIAAIDAALSAGNGVEGLRLDALHEIAGAAPGLAHDAAATLFAAGIAARSWGPVLWVVRRQDLFAPGVEQAGLAGHRILHAEAADDADLLTLMEEGLRHRGLGAVIGETARRIPAEDSRRLQRAAEGGRTIALLLRRHGRGGGDPFRTGSAAATRWRIGALAPAPSPATGRVKPRWSVTLAGPVARGGRENDAPAPASEWTVEACDASGRCMVPFHPRRGGFPDRGEALRAA